jgi:hypothetical protein
MTFALARFPRVRLNMSRILNYSLNIQNNKIPKLTPYALARVPRVRFKQSRSLNYSINIQNNKTSKLTPYALALVPRMRHNMSRILNYSINIQNNQLQNFPHPLFLSFHPIKHLFHNVLIMYIFEPLCNLCQPLFVHIQALGLSTKKRVSSLKAVSSR